MMGLADLFAAIAAPLVDSYGGGDVYLSAGLALITVVTFVGLLTYARTLTHDEKSKLSEFGMREVIALTMVLVYLVLVVWTAFFVASAKQSQISRDLISNFTALVGVVIAFYFGGGAIERAYRARAGKPAPDQESTEGDEPDRPDDEMFR